MASASPRVTTVDVPAESRVATVYASTDLADAYAISLPARASRDPETLARFLFAQQPAWIGALMGLRDALVAGFGLKTAGRLRAVGAAAPRERVGIFKIYESNAREIVLGEDDKHLDFRLSVLCRAESSQLILSTVVNCHNALGRSYIALIAPFHRLVVRASMRRAARAGWPGRE